MNLDPQIQELIDNAPQDGTTPVLIQAIAPAIRLMAENLKHPEYYVPRTVDGNWLMVTLRNRSKPSVEKHMISAYSTLKDAEVGSQIMSNPTIDPLPIPVTHILFHMLAMKTVDSVIFFETPENLQDGVEIFRNALQENIRTHVQMLKQQGSSTIA
ncbi:hypothetical protein [Okeania sp. SIO2G5]|uniref:hypothetical protein n=1 Tax=Okeania sp. SIO2G5 TaxID=2607796 RepID=UPI0013BEB832|nr:hypothetical protein [Okeania sp. SIO2G5]NEP76524.1 hypothetical protein [Okeania sp. SIO2G5]